MDYQSFLKNFQIKPVIIHQDISDQKPLASICILTYQHVNYIKQCLDGILMQQTTFPFEILLGEDASSDGTREICLEYAANHPDKIRLFLHHRENNIAINGTPTGRFNFLYNLYNARGKYIAICEGDDYWTDPLKLQKQVDFLERNQEYVMCYHNAKIVDENDQFVKESKLPLNCQSDFESIELKIGAFVLTLSVCFRNLIKDFPPEMYKVVNGDTFLFSLLGHYGKGKYLSSVKDAVYRAHEAGIWSSLNKIKRKASSLETNIYLSRYYKRINDKESASMIKEQSISLIGSTLLSNDQKAINKTLKFLIMELKFLPIFWFLLYSMSFFLFKKGYYFQSRLLKSIK